MNIETALELYLLACSSSDTKKTLRWKEMTSQSMIIFFNNLSDVKDLSDITVDMIHKFMISERDRGLEPVTINKKRGLLEAIFDYHDIETINWKKIKRIPTKKSVRDRLSDDDIVMLFKYLESLEETSKDNNFVYKTLFYFMLDAGTRATETLFIKKENIDFENREIKLTEEIKFNKERYVYFTNFSEPYIRKLYELSDNEFLFVNLLKNRQLDYDSDVQYFHRKLKKELNKRGITCHIMRHTFASISLQNGMSILSLQQILGHSSIRSTQVYVHADRRRSKRDYERFSIFKGDYMEQVNIEKNKS